MRRGEVMARSHESHGQARTRTYRIWTQMKQRCHNENAEAYEYYGGRGITVCKRWLDSFAAFFADMGKCPSEEHSIDRKKNHLGYSKENCEWVTRDEQMRNTRMNRNLTFNGKTQCMKDWADEIGVKPHTLLWRIENWGEDKALSTVGPRERSLPRQGRRMLTLGEQTMSLSDWAREVGASKQLLRLRIKKHGEQLAIAGLLVEKEARQKSPQSDRSAG